MGGRCCADARAVKQREPINSTPIARTRFALAMWRMECTWVAAVQARAGAAVSWRTAEHVRHRRTYRKHATRDAFHKKDRPKVTSARWVALRGRTTQSRGPMQLTANRITASLSLLLLTAACTNRVPAAPTGQ